MRLYKSDSFVEISADFQVNIRWPPPPLAVHSGGGPLTVAPSLGSSPAAADFTQGPGPSGGVLMDLRTWGWGEASRTLVRRRTVHIMNTAPNFCLMFSLINQLLGHTWD